MRILVTGGAGFIGGHIARAFSKLGHNVVVVDNLKTGDLRNIPSNAQFENLTLGRDDIDHLFNIPFDSIYHFAGQSSVQLSYEDPVYDLDSNTRSTLTLLDLAYHRSPHAHFVYASTMSVYGGQGPFPKTESMLPEGKNFYAIGKTASELYIRLYMTKGLNATILRLFNIYGPGQNLSNLSQGMLSIYLAQALKSSQIVVKGPTDRTRDFLYVGDLVNTILTINQCSKSFGHTFNLCSGVETSVHQVISSIQSLLQKEIDVIELPGTPGDIPRMVGSSRKLSEVFPGLPLTPLSTGLKITIDSYHNENYFSSL